MSAEVDLQSRAEPESELESDEGRLVFAWRLDQLLRAGYGDATAVALALRGDVDLHEAVELPTRGCPLDTAARILL